MPTRKSPRKGSLQFWPRKRASKFLPSVNWKALTTSKHLKGFIVYKAGMTSAEVKDKTPNSLTKDKKIMIPVTILECPPMKIFSVRLYNNGKVTKDILAENLEKELKRRVKLPKKKESTKALENVKSDQFQELRIICYSIPKKAGIKKRPDLSEISLTGTTEEQLAFVKEHIDKEILIADVFENGGLVDVRGLTKGKGFSGPVKRFGIKLKASKSEKGRRRPGSIGPWHPARVIFRVPMAGQLGMFTRTHYNHKIIDMGSSTEKKMKPLKNYGNIKTDFLIVRGSVQGPAKRQLLATAPLRQTKKQSKKDYELIEIK